MILGIIGLIVVQVPVTEGGRYPGEANARAGKMPAQKRNVAFWFDWYSLECRSLTVAFMVSPNWRRGKVGESCGGVRGEWWKSIEDLGRKARVRERQWLAEQITERGKSCEEN